MYQNVYPNLKKTNNYLKICVLYSCSCVGPIEVKGMDKTPLHNKLGERSYSSRNQRFWVPWITNLVPLGAMTSCSGYHDITLGEPSEGTLLNVHKIKDKS